ncbi:copper resistance protein B [Porphyrobacter sp. GA68]|uniref:copper resistance protein B n=1 Tax=Porphyrobacter sp. GA68 TaxID=2883480 RepID=UPI001D18E42F|nr:copper resistance protein B [Porphyrobacter sp. GA68]
MPLLSLPLLAFAPLPVPALAQDQGGHDMPQAEEPLQPSDDPHAGHAMPAPAGATEPPPTDPHAGHSMPADAQPVEPAAAMDHSAMDHGAMGHGDMDTAASPGPEFETPPPPEAGSGPPRAADAIWGAEAMAASRAELQRTHGDFAVFWFQSDRLEVQSREGTDGYLWDLQGYYGGPTSRFWFKSEGEGAFGQRVEDAEVQALYSRAISPFWDLQAGVRQDVAGRDTTHGVLGIQGLAPYLYEIDAALFVSHRGDVTARIEAELDQRITQRLILQPRAEVNLSAQDVPLLGLGSGIDKAELGIRLRYEIIREFAPYIGVEQSWRVGGSADYARAAGEDPSVTSYVAGIRFWF